MSAKIQRIKDATQNCTEGIERRKAELRDASPEDRHNIGMGIWGATKHIYRLEGQLLTALKAQHVRTGYDGDATTLCACGGRIAGRPGRDFPRQEFANQPGHVPLDEIEVTKFREARELAELRAAKAARGDFHACG